MRVHAVFRRGDFKPAADATQADADAFFAQLAPGVDDPVIDRDHAGMAIVAINPKLAMQMAAMSRFLALDLAFCKRLDLRELVIQTTHIKSKCGFAFESRLAGSGKTGISPEQLAALALWRSSSLFNEEQRLVIEYAEAVFDHAVSDELLARFVAAFDEKSAIECATVVGFWSCWAMVIDVARP